MSLNEQEMLTACIRSLHFPNLGTFIVYEEGAELPSALKTVIVIVRVGDDGRGRDKYIKGSNVTESLLQTGQTNVDLYWPCSQPIYSQYYFIEAYWKRIKSQRITKK